MVQKLRQVVLEVNVRVKASVQIFQQPHMLTQAFLLFATNGFCVTSGWMPAGFTNRSTLSSNQAKVTFELSKMARPSTIPAMFLIPWWMRAKSQAQHDVISKLAPSY